MKNNNKGFTLIEVICSVALLAIIITASAAFFKSVYLSQQGSKRQLYANNIAQTVMEEVIRTGDLTKDYTASYGKGEFTIDVTSQPNAATIGGNGRDLNGDGVVDQKDRDLAATMYPDRPTTTKIPITYEATNVPEVGNTNKPEGTSGPIQDYDGEAFNIHIDMSDFIDEDLEMLVAAGTILQSKSNAPYSKDDIVNILNSSSDFSKYKNGASAGDKASNVEKAAVFYRYLTPSMLSGALSTVTSYYNTATNHIKSYISGTSFASSFIGYTESAEFYNEIMSSYNLVTTICDLYVNRDEIVSSYDSSGNLKNTGFTSLNGLPKDSVNSLLNSYIFQNAYLYLNSRAIPVNGQRGPRTIQKFMDNNDEIKSYSIDGFENKTNDVGDSTDDTKVYDGYGNIVKDSAPGLSDFRPAINWQLAGRRINCYTFSNSEFTSISWPNSTDKNSTTPDSDGPYGIKLVNLPQTKAATQAAINGDSSGNYFQTDILHKFSFYISGGISYYPLKITAYFRSDGNFAAYYYDLDAGDMVSYSPAVYYYKGIDYGADLYRFKLWNQGGWGNMNKQSNYDPKNETKNNGGSGGPGGGNGGSIDTDHGVQREKVTLWLELNVDQTDLYTVRVKDRKGKVVSELICDGNQALFKAV